MSGAGSAPSGNTTSVQQSQPWAGQLPFLGGTGASGQGGTNTGSGTWSQYFNPGTQIPGTNVDAPSSSSQGIIGALPAAAALYQNYAPQYYPGTTYAPETSAQSSAITGQENLGLSGSPITGAANSAAANILNPNFLNSNPGSSIYSSMANGPQENAAIQSAVANATPGLLDSFTGGNRLNSPGAAYAVGQGVTNAAAPYVLQAQQQAAQGLSQNYSTAAGQQNTADLTAPGIQGMSYTDLANAYGAGTAQQGLSQNTINDQVARYNYGQTLPYNLLDQYLGGVSGNFGSTQSLSTPYFSQQTGGLGGAVTGGLGGAAAGALAGTYLFPGVGTLLGAGIGAGAGGLLGGFS